MTLDQLSQAFSVMLGRKDRPISTELNSPAEANETVPPSAEESVVVDAIDSINARTIVEAVLFVGRPDNVPVTSQQVASAVRGVSVEQIDHAISAAQFAVRGK